MKALLFERKVARYAAAAVAGRLAPGRGARVGPLRLADVDPPELPGAGLGAGAAAPRRASAGPTSPPSTGTAAATSSRSCRSRSCPATRSSATSTTAAASCSSRSSPARCEASTPPCDAVPPRAVQPVRADRLRPPRARPADRLLRVDRRRLVDAASSPTSASSSTSPTTSPTSRPCSSSRPPAPCTPRAASHDEGPVAAHRHRRPRPAHPRRHPPRREPGVDDHRHRQAPPPEAAGQGARRRRRVRAPASSPATSAAATGVVAARRPAHRRRRPGRRLRRLGRLAAAGARRRRARAASCTSSACPAHTDARPHRPVAQGDPAARAATPTSRRRLRRRHRARARPRPRPARVGHLPPVPLTEDAIEPRRQRRPPWRRQHRLRPPRREGKEPDLACPDPGSSSRSTSRPRPSSSATASASASSACPPSAAASSTRPSRSPPLKDPDAAIREALLNPLDCEPLPELLHAGHEADDRLRRRVAAAAADAPARQPPARHRGRARHGRRRRRRRHPPHRRPRPAPPHDRGGAAPRRRRPRLRRLRPDRPHLQPRRRGPRRDGSRSARPKHGELVEINKRAAESDLLVYVNINLVSMDGGWKSTATGLAGYRSPQAAPQPGDDAGSRSRSWTATSPSCTTRNWRMGEVLKADGPRIFQIETTLNNDTYPAPFDFLMKREWEWTAKDRALYIGTAKSLDRTPPAMARKIFHSIRAPHRMTSVHAGAVDPVHEATLAQNAKEHVVHVEGQTDVLTMGLPFICPYNVNSIMNPILVMCTGLGYFFNMYRGRPLVREGGVLILTHPTPWDFHPVHHPSYIDFFEQVLAETTDPMEMEARFEKSFAEDEWYRHLYRTSYAYHGVHPVLHVVLGRARPAAPRRHRPRHRRRRRRRRRCAGSASGRRRRWPTPSRWRRTTSAASRRSPTSTCRRSCWPRCSERRATALPEAAAARRSRTRRRRCRAASSRRRKEPRSGADYDTDWAALPVARWARVVLLESRAAADGRAPSPSPSGAASTASPTSPSADPAPAGRSSPPTTTATSTRRCSSRRSPSRGATRSSSAPPPTTSSPTRSPRRPRRSPSTPSPSSARGVSRRSRRAGRGAARATGWSLVLFPEGGRSPDGWGQPHKGGAAWLARAHRRAGRARSTSPAPAASSPRAPRS